MLIDQLISQGYLKTPRIIQAFRKIKREDFIPEEFKDQAEGNYPLSIGYGQTISQPLTVAFMLELLQPEPGDKVLDIGSGSGWVTALLAYIVSQKRNSKSKILNSKQIQNSNFQNSKQDNLQSLDQELPSVQVYAIERIPEIKEFGENNIRKYNFIDKKIVQFFCHDGTKGLPEFAPFDKIHIAAAAEEIPQALKDQLAVSGRMVIPIKGGILKLDRISEKKFKEEFFPDFVFVPLVSSEFRL
jgi:protein-L-isoaspartate(D-aspartate) O-methyltransferase